MYPAPKTRQSSPTQAVGLKFHPSKTNSVRLRAPQHVFRSQCLRKHNVQLPSRRQSSQVVAHGSHESDSDHSHPHRHSHSHSHSSSCCSSLDICGDDGEQSHSDNPFHRALDAIYTATRLSHLSHWLGSSTFSSIAKIILFFIAAGTAWSSGRLTTPATQAATLLKLSHAATAAVYFFAGIPAAMDLSFDLTAGRIDTHVLMNLAVIGTLATGYPLEGALLLVLFQTSHVVEHLLTDKARGNLNALYNTVPDTANTIQIDSSTDDNTPIMSTLKTVPARDVHVGDCVFVRPGEQVPLDGEILHGRALVSAEHLTGESLPTLKRPGDSIPAGAVCHDGALTVRVLNGVEESTPARIARLTEDAQAQRPKLRTWLDQVGEYYSRAVILAAFVAFVLMTATGIPVAKAVYRSMGLLTVASPCALVMVPLAYVSAIAAIASRGVLVKGGRVLDALATCRVVAVDKTGTLTTGRLALTRLQRIKLINDGGTASITDVASLANGGSGAAARTEKLQDNDRRLALEAAAALSLRSTHPVSDAVVLQALSEGISGDGVDVGDFRLTPGGGAEGTVDCSTSNSTILNSIGSSGSSSSSTFDGGSTSGDDDGSSSTQRYRAIFGSLEFVSSRLSRGEESVVASLLSAQRLTNVVSILVLKPISRYDTTTSTSSTGNGSTSNINTAKHGVWVFSFEDSVRLQSAAAVKDLQTGSWAKSRGTEKYACDVVMLTGDNAANAQRIAKKLGIDHVRAGISPEQKLQYVKAYRSDAPPLTTAAMEKLATTDGNGGSSRTMISKNGVVMVGDGLNDAAALAAADVGIAVASDATAAASLAADAVVLSSSSGFGALPLLLRVARATRHVVRQNLALAAGSILCLALPTVLGFVPLWVAVMFHEGSTLLVALNSLRLLRFSAAFVRDGGGNKESSSVSGSGVGVVKKKEVGGGSDAAAEERVANLWRVDTACSS